MSASLPSNSVAERYRRLCDHYLTLSDRFADLQGHYDLVQLKFAELYQNHQHLQQQANLAQEEKQAALSQLAAAQSTIADLRSQMQTVIEHNQQLTASLAQAEATQQHLTQERQAWENRCHALEVLEEFNSLMETEALYRLSEVEQAIAINQEILTSAPSQDLEQATAVLHQYTSRSTPVRGVRSSQPVSVV